MYKQKNTVLITFKNGKTLESTGRYSSIVPTDINEDLKWIGMLIPGYIRDDGRDRKEVKKIEISIDYSEE